MKAGIRLHGTKAADQVFATCCALHVSRSFRGVEPNYRPHHDHASCLQNFLLEVDGLDAQWENGVPGIWEGPLGEHDAADVPLIFARVQATGLESDLSGMENGEDDSKIGGAGESEDEGDEDRGASESSTGGTLRAEGGGGIDGSEGGRTDSDGARIKVWNIPFEVFRQKPITHFKIRRERKYVKWPSRNGVVAKEEAVF